MFWLSHKVGAPGMVPFRCDTLPSRTGSSAQSGPVGRGGELVVAAGEAVWPRQTGWPCSGSLRQWVVAAATEKEENDDAADERGRAGRRGRGP